MVVVIRGRVVVVVLDVVVTRAGGVVVATMQPLLLAPFVQQNSLLAPLRQQNLPVRDNYWNLVKYFIDAI